MSTNLLRSAFLFRMVLLIAAITCIGMTGLKAQPTNYCNPMTYGPEGIYRYCYWEDDWGRQYYWSYITGVQVAEVETANVIYENSSADEGCYVIKEDVINMMLGTEYDLNVTYYHNYYCDYGWGYWIYNRLRIFIDWNQDGDFKDQEPGPMNEFVYGTPDNWDDYYEEACINSTKGIRIQIPCNVPSGKTKMRVMVSKYDPYPYDGYYNDACINGWYYISEWGNYNYIYGEIEDYTLNFTSSITASFPDDRSDETSILYANEVYDGTERLKNGAMTSFPKPSVSFSTPQPYGTYLTYKIVGPLPSSNVVYEALDPETGLPEIQIGGTESTSYEIQRARGTNAYPQGNSDGSFMSSQGGEYRVVMRVTGTGCPGEGYKLFNVSWTNDLAARDIVSPKSNGAPRFFKYLRGNTIRVTGLFQNVGVSDVTSFNARAVIVGPGNNYRDTLYNSTFIYDTSNPGQQVLGPKQKIEINFSPNFRSLEAGIYKMYLHCDLTNAIDQEDYNDHFPRQGEVYTFEIQHEIQLQASRLILPFQGQQLLGNRPIIPMGEFKNVGVGDASDIPAKLVVKRLFGNYGTVYESNVTVQDVPSGKYNTNTQEFDPMTLRETGNYSACLIISHPDDAVRTDDTICVNFSVSGGLEGTYTVGTTGSGPRNFTTIDSAMNALYRRGLAGPVTFELTDAVYNVTNRSNGPAWDFSSFIINSGFNSQTNTYNTITWKPSATRALQKGGVTINLHSGIGKGVSFGQSITPSNKYALFNEFASRVSMSRKYANSNGYITFDGGARKSLKFVLHSGSDISGSVFYLGKGSSNITIKNVLMEASTPNMANNVWLPMTVYSPINGFIFQDDTLNTEDQDYGYTAGVVIRATLDRSDKSLAYRLDTLQNTNNTIQGNEISGFGYGIMSLGYGELLIERTGDYQRFFNSNNTIKENIIHDVARAGIYLGYEENSKIENNRIYNVGGILDIPAAGIMAGGDASRDYKGYHNINLSISGNEISGITSSVYSAGIRVEQDRNTYPHAVKTQVHFPDISENMNISNNTVWGVMISNASADRAGIHILTERNGSLVDPMNADYNTRNDKVVNNTIIMGGDGGMINTGAVAGIAIQNATGAKLYNNAIAVLDNEVANTNPAIAAVLYQGVMPKDGGLDADRNAYWIPATSPATIYRFIETDASNNVLELGWREDYKRLQQWQIWTGEDQHSVFGDFTADMVYTGSEPNRRLRINGTPVGSILNNRGERIDWVTTDIDGTTRGAAGQRYDIGAVEFVGGMRVNDIESETITSPAAYQSGIGRFSDAEYVMTTAPVEVKALLRNNGSIQASGIDAFVRVYMETPNGTFPTTPIIDRRIEVNVASAESIEAIFNLADGQNPDFRPQPYSELTGQGYVPAAHFRSMSANVTPRYKIEVTVESDQYNANNLVSKIVRFYIPRSALSMIVSAENSMTEVTGESDVNEIAGRLNFDSLMNGFSQIGWYTSTDSNRYDIDIFDRLGWEPKTVNYSMYRVMFWSDGDDKSLGRYERRDIRNFLSNGSNLDKKNLVIGSQEMVRSNEPVDPIFVHEALSAMYTEPGNPLGIDGNNDGNTLVGVQVGRGLSEKIEATSFEGDLPPYAGLMSIYTDVDGLAKPSHYYRNHTAAMRDSIAGVAASTMTRNVIVLGVDWRHYGNIEGIIRQQIDFLEKNGMIPVELVEFNVVAGDKRVEISWATASELNSDRFEIERSVKVDDFKSEFVKIGEEKASGNSSSVIQYGPITDRDVSLNGTYYYRLRMIDKDGSSALSHEVAVQFTGVENGNDTEANMTLWLDRVQPNPVSGVAEVLYNTSTSGEVELALYDMTGRKIMTLQSGKVDAGSHTVSINVSGLVSGTYTLMLKSGSQSATHPLTVVK